MRTACKSKIRTPLLSPTCQNSTKSSSSSRANMSQLTLSNGAVCWTSSLRFRSIKVFTVWMLRIQTHQPPSRPASPPQTHTHAHTHIHTNTGDDPQTETETTIDVPLMSGVNAWPKLWGAKTVFLLLLFLTNCAHSRGNVQSLNWSSNMDDINIWETVVFTKRMAVCGRVGELGHKCVFIAVCSLFLSSEKFFFFFPSSQACWLFKEWVLVYGILEIANQIKD